MTRAIDILNDSLENIAPFMENNKKIAYFNFKKVMQSFHEHSVMESDFTGTTGYGYDDIGRDKLEDIYRTIFKAEDALVRSQIISGTHAISLSLLSLLNKGDELLYITGWPYETLEKVIGESEDDIGSMKEIGIKFNYIDLIDDAYFDENKILNSINDKTKVVGIQRSRGYSTRQSVTISQIESIIYKIKQQYPDIIIFVDNCYGEFVETKEPIEVGADVVAGSLIKNPGGGLAKMGGYVVGQQDLITRISYRLSVPGIGKEMGASLDNLLDMYQGLFMAPHAVIESLNGAILISYTLSKLGFKTDPLFDATRTDLIQSIEFNNEEEMITFIQMVQSASPVNSKFLPIPDNIPGYQHPVIMAAGTFVQGASIELSADGPVRPPYIAFLQGGLVFEHVQYALENVLQAWIEKNII